MYYLKYLLSQQSQEQVKELNYKVSGCFILFLVTSEIQEQKASGRIQRLHLAKESEQELASFCNPDWLSS